MFEGITIDHLDSISNVLEAREEESGPAESIRNKERTVSANIREIEKQITKLQNMNFFLKMSTDQNADDEADFEKEINKKTDEINKLIDKISQNYEEHEINGLNNMTNDDHIKTNLFEYYKGEIEQSKIREVSKGRKFKEFYKNQLDMRKEEVKKQFESEKFFSMDELLSIQDLIQNLIDL